MQVGPVSREEEAALATVNESNREKKKSLNGEEKW